MRLLSLRTVALLLSALPLCAQLNFNSGNFGTFGIGPTTFLLFSPTGGSGSYTFSYAPLATPIPGFRVINAPELPNFANASQTGGLAGLPTSAGPVSTTIRLTDNVTSLFVDKPVSFTISPVDLIGFAPNNYSIGDTVSAQFWPVGGTPPYTYTLSGTLPPGLSLTSQVINNENVAVVSGTIANTANTQTTTAGNTYNFTITIQDSSVPSNSFGRGFNMAVSAMQLQVNGQPLNQGGNRVLPQANAGLVYNQQIIATGGTPPYRFTLDPENAPPNGISLSSGGLLSGTPPNQNFFGNFTIDVTDSVNHFMRTRLSLQILPPTPVPLSLSTNTIGDSAVGSNDSWGIYANGGLPPYTFAIDPARPLPAGAVLIQGPEQAPDWDPQPGYVRVRIQTPGTYNFNVLVTDSAGNHASRPYTLIVRPLWVNEFPGNATLGVAFSKYLIPVGGTPPYTVAPVNIPAGLTVDNTGLVSGTPQEAGNFLPFVFTLTDSSGNQFNQYTNNQGNFTLISSTTNPGLALTGGDFGTFSAGNPMQLNLIANSAQVPPSYTVSLVSGTIPSGLKLLTGSDFSNNDNPNVVAALAGIPTAPGPYSFVYRVVDGLGQVGQRQVKLRISGMAIVNNQIASGTIGLPYGPQTLDVRGGTPPYQFSLTTGNLPTGLSLDPNTGTISGTPLTTASNFITIQVQDSAGDVFRRGFSLNIYPIQITGPSILPTAVFGQQYSYTFTPSPAGSYTFTSSNFLAGLSLGANTGILSGIPTATGTLNINVTAFNNNTGAVVSRVFTLFVPAFPNFISGLPTQEISVNGVPTALLGTTTVGSSAFFTLFPNGGTPPYTITLVGGTLPTGMSIVPVNIVQGVVGFGRWALAGVPTAAGTFTFRLRYTDATGYFEERTEAFQVFNGFAVASVNPGIGIVNQPYSAQLQGVGGNGTYTFALDPEVPFNFLPPGLTLSASGLVSGTPTSTGFFSPAIDITSGGVTRRLQINFTINATPDNRQITFNLGPQLNDTSAGKSLFFTLTPSGGAGTHTWSVVAGALPSGVQVMTDGALPPGFTAPNAILAGAPTTPGTYHFRIRVDDSTGNFGIQDASLTVTAMQITPVNFPFTGGLVPPPGQVGQPYSLTLGALNATAPLTFTTDPGTLLPAGLSLSAAGVLGGTPTDAGNFQHIGHVTDANGNVFHGVLNFGIIAAGGSIGPVTPFEQFANLGLPSATANSPYTFTLNDLLTPGSGTPPVTWTVSAGLLPAGLSVVPGTATTSATLSGTPTTPGNYVFSLLATDANGKTAAVQEVQFTVSVLGLAPPRGALAPAVAGVAYQTSLIASGGTPPYTFTTDVPSDMPSGLSLSPAGVLSGTPVFAGFHVVNVIAKDSAGSIFRQRYSVTVAPAGTVSPAFTLTPDSINISYTIGDPAPAPIPLSVKSTSTALSYSVNASGGSWLSVTANSGVTPGAPSTVIAPAGLAANTYNGSITFTSAGASNSPDSIPVTLTVLTPVVCSFLLSATASAPIPAGGSVSGQFNISTGAACNWSVSTGSLPPWITVTSGYPSSGTGPGTVYFTIAPNTTATQRTGNIVVNGLAYSVTQFGTSCSFSLARQSASVAAVAGSGPVGVIASAPGCAWNSLQVDPWISSPVPASGRGSNLTLSVTVAANPLPQSRTGTILIAGQTFTVNQLGVGCTFSLSSAGAPVSSAGQAANSPVTFNVRAPAGCAWSADTGPSWLSLVSGSPGSGNGTVSLAIAPNSSTADRTANVLLGGQVFQVTQAGVPCNFSIVANNNPVQPAAGGNGSMDIIANAGCGWTASTPSTWVHIVNNTGTGNATVNFSVDSNATGAVRSTTLVIAGQSVTINQNGPTCSYSLQSGSATVPGAGTGAASVMVNTAAGCGPWSISGQPSWVTPGAASYNGPATATYSVSPNLTGADRFAAFTIAGQTFTVTQPAAACAITLNSPSTNAGEFGGAGQFTFTTSPAGCVAPIQSTTSWITLGDLSTPGTVNFTVAANTFAAARSGTILVGDQSYTVNQVASSCQYTLTSFAPAQTYSRLGGDGTIPVNFAPAACGAPPVIVNGPGGMITLNPVTAGPGLYTENYSVGIYQSFINYTRTSQLVINGQIFTVKQNSW